MPLNPYSLLVNSSDNFEDCWVPFFQLLKKNWGTMDVSILLNTEFKVFSFDGLSIKSSQSHLFETNRKLTWSECLINALKMIESPIVLYMQEDYFIEKSVKTDVINDFVILMMENKNIKHIGLTHFGSNPPFSKYENDDRLWYINQNNKYRISTQAGLWDKNTLLSYLCPEESGWMFEIFGTKRANRRKDIFLTVNREIYNPQNGSIIEYTHTGIIKGKWHKAIPTLFRENNIVVDFSKRGFYEPRSIVFRKIETGKKILTNPKKIIRGILGK